MEQHSLVNTNCTFTIGIASLVHLLQIGGGGYSHNGSHFINLCSLCISARFHQHRLLLFLSSVKPWQMPLNKAPTEGENKEQGVCHLHLKSIWRQKKNYGNSNISQCKNIIFKKSSKIKQNPSRDYNSITNLKFQHKPEYHLSKILI